MSEQRYDAPGEELDRELERRLEIIEATEDPARKDLPAIDFILLAIPVVPTSVLMFAWG